MLRCCCHNPGSLLTLSIRARVDQDRSININLISLLQQSSRESPFQVLVDDDDDADHNEAGDRRHNETFDMMKAKWDL